MNYGPDIEDFARSTMSARVALLSDFAREAPSPAREFLQGCAQTLNWLGRERLDPMTGTHALAGRLQVQAVLEHAATEVNDPRCAGVLAALVLSCDSALDGHHALL